MGDKPYDPDLTLVSKAEKRKNNWSSSKMMNPWITWGMLISIASTAAYAGIKYSNLEAGIVSVETASLARHAIAMRAVSVERDMRIIVSSNNSDDMAEVKEDLKDLRKEVKEGDEKTQDLLRELLRNQNQSGSN